MFWCFQQDNIIALRSINHTEGMCIMLPRVVGEHLQHAKEWICSIRPSSKWQCNTNIHLYWFEITKVLVRTFRLINMSHSSFHHWNIKPPYQWRKKCIQNGQLPTWLKLHLSTLGIWAYKIVGTWLQNTVAYVSVSTFACGYQFNVT